MWAVIVPALAAIVVAVVESIAARERKANKEEREKQEARAERRAEETQLSMQLLSANLQLSIVTANALTGGHNNGNVERARVAAEQAETAYNAFLQKIAAKEVAK